LNYLKKEKKKKQLKTYRSDNLIEKFTAIKTGKEWPEDTHFVTDEPIFGSSQSSYVCC
jgi:hypothetical protein